MHTYTHIRTHTKLLQNYKVNYYIKDKSPSYLAGYYESLSGNDYQAAVTHEDKLKLLKFLARSD